MAFLEVTQRCLGHHLHAHAASSVRCSGARQRVPWMWATPAALDGLSVHVLPPRRARPRRRRDGQPPDNMRVRRHSVSSKLLAHNLRAHEQVARSSRTCRLPRVRAPHGQLRVSLA